jgi:dipeptidyl aminopeptidase/acylaminoacyl peptidase
MRSIRYPLLTVLLGCTACAGSTTSTKTTSKAGAKAASTATTSTPVNKAKPAAKRRAYDAKTLYDTTSFFGASFSPDESKLLVTSDERGVFDVFVVDIASKKRTPLLPASKENRYAVSYFPKDERVLFRADQGGNELYHLYVREKDGAIKDLTPAKKARASFAGWSKDKRAFFVALNERDKRYFDIYRYDATSYKRKLVFKNTAGFNPRAVSASGRYVALHKVRNNADSDTYILDTKRRKKPRLISKHQGARNYTPMAFSPDEGLLVYATDAKGEFYQAWTYDLARGKHQKLVAAQWDVTSLSFSEKGRYRISATNEDARTVLAVYDRREKRPVALPKMPTGDIRGVVVSRSETKLAFYVNGDTAPSNLFVFDLNQKKVTQLTRSLSPKVARRELVESKGVRFASFDGMKIPALLYKPRFASARRRVPALVWVHGGPGGQTRRRYSPTLQYLVNHGYAVFAVNNRGSSGYGKTFFHADDKRHGDVDLKDCIWGRRYLESLPWVDKKRIGIIGGSYGGFMVAAALAFAPKAFEVGIDIFGVTNWLRTLKSIPPYWAYFRAYLYAELGDPAKEAKRLRRISPLFSAHKIVRPLMVIQGKNDPRVLKVESDELVAAVKKNGVPVEYLVFDDEGHGFRKKKNRIAAASAYRRFLDRHLRK